MAGWKELCKGLDMESDLIPTGRRSDSVKLRSWNFHCARPEEDPHNKTCSTTGRRPNGTQITTASLGEALPIHGQLKQSGVAGSLNTVTLSADASQQALLRLCDALRGREWPAPASTARRESDGRAPRGPQCRGVQGQSI